MLSSLNHREQFLCIRKLEDFSINFNTIINLFYYSFDNLFELLSVRYN